MNNFQESDKAVYNVTKSKEMYCNMTINTLKTKN